MTLPDELEAAVSELKEPNGPAGDAIMCAAARSRAAGARGGEVKYDVLTWDVERQEWTPQQGVRRGPYTLWGLRRALRTLQQLGYPCHRQDSFVLVQAREEQAREEQADE